MGIICCASREPQPCYMEQVRQEMEQDKRFKTAIQIKPLVNMLPEVNKRKFKSTPQKSIKTPRMQAQVQDKFDLKVDLLLERLKRDLAELRRTHGSLQNPEFKKQLLVTIGANTREISKLVIQLYQSRRMLALERLTNNSCRLGPKMDQTISGGSRPRKDDTMGVTDRSSRSVRKNLAKNGGFATERAWIEARLAYRKLVFKMIKEIEAYCDDVICLTQNFLQLTPEQFETICDQDQIEMIVKETHAEIQKKQEMLRQDLNAEDDQSSDSDDDYSRYSEESSGMRQNGINTQFNSGASPATTTTNADEEEKKDAELASFKSNFSSIADKFYIEKPKCLLILQQIIAIKREQTFCQMADKEIFLTSEKSTFSSQSSASASDNSSQRNYEAANQLTTEEEVFLMNIDYFEQWDRIYQKFDVQEKDVLLSMKGHGIRMI